MRRNLSPTELTHEIETDTVQSLETAPLMLGTYQNQNLVYAVTVDSSSSLLRNLFSWCVLHVLSVLVVFF